MGGDFMQPKPVKIYTAQYRYSGPDRLDITVKNGERIFAPTWNMVMSFKNGQLNKRAYIKQYYALMRRSYKRNKNRWLDVLNRERVVLTCYCGSGEFCHRILLAKILGKLGGKYMGEIGGE